MKKKGFTLIEMMLALSLFSIFVVFLNSAYFSQVKENTSFVTRLDLKYNGDKALNSITDELRSNIIPSSGSVTQVKATSGTLLIDLTGSTSPSELQLSSQNTLVANANSNPVVLCKGITSITLQYSGDLMLITVDLKSKNDEYTVTSAVNIKN